MASLAGGERPEAAEETAATALAGVAGTLSKVPGGAGSVRAEVSR
jgi:uncharacterized membrane protein YbhN (UPF0104 family)